MKDNNIIHNAFAIFSFLAWLVIAIYGLFGAFYLVGESKKFDFNIWTLIFGVAIYTAFVFIWSRQLLKSIKSFKEKGRFTSFMKS